ncbi:MAG TPA: class I SAM-dependent methyltransferase [Dissulfurispiraceae bacterium]|nr:class I SAM-dependent methyltransferase [Dissulfurispiraceae bacterium]
MLRIYETGEFADLSPYRNWSPEMWRRRADRTYRTTAQKVELISRFLPPAVNLLDVGCATGLFVLEANERGFRCEGIEPSSMLLTIARDVLKVPVSTTQIEDFRSERTFNGIILWDVLEHAYDPMRVLRACANLLVPGGMIFLQVPHADGMSFRLKSLLSMVGLKKPGYKHFGVPWHVYAFNRKSLGAMLQHCGLETVHLESWSHFLKDGRESFPEDVIIRAARRFCLSDYIVCVARKRQEYAGS